MKFRQKVTVDAAKWTGENLDEMRQVIGDGPPLRINGAKRRLFVYIQGDDRDPVVVGLGDYLVVKPQCGADNCFDVFTVGLRGNALRGWRRFRSM